MDSVYLRWLLVRSSHSHLNTSRESRLTAEKPSCIWTWKRKANRSRTPEQHVPLHSAQLKREDSSLFDGRQPKSCLDCLDHASECLEGRFTHSSCFLDGSLDGVPSTYSVVWYRGGWVMADVWHQIHRIFFAEPFFLLGSTCSPKIAAHKTGETKSKKALKYLFSTS